MIDSEILVSVIAVLQHNADVLPAFVSETYSVLAQHYANFEIVLVDNASTDDTLGVVREILEKQKCVRYFRLPRPADPEMAVMAGLDAVIGDVVVTIHPDFDPPDQLVKLVETC